MKPAAGIIQGSRDLAAFVGNERGQMTIVSLIFFVALMAVGGLAIDMGRLYSLQGQIQTYVDVTALASASQLDGQSNAVCRAIAAAVGHVSGDAGCTTNAATSLLTGQQYFAAGSHQLQVQQLMFLSALGVDLGARAATPLNNDIVVCTVVAPGFDASGCPANADKVAKFVEVRDVPEQMSFLLMPVMKTFVGTYVARETLGLKATAGYRSQVCDLTPLMICNPNEPAANNDTLYPYTPTVGQQILMKASSSAGNASWAPGDFGLLQVPNDAGGQCAGNGQGAGLITCIVALVDPLTQCISGSVSIKPGQAETTSNGWNVRFDIYQQSANKFQGEQAFAPASDVVKGICDVNGGKCKTTCPNNYAPTPSAYPSVPLPRDANLKDVNLGNRIGTGVALSDVTTYWLTNHPNDATVPADVAQACAPAAFGSQACRYAIYQHELLNGIPNITNGENGNPVCTTPPVPSSALRDRRTLTMAVVNCHANGLSGSNHNQPVPVVAYVRMFLTEPLGLQEDATGKVTGFANSSNNAYGEVLGVVKPGDQTGILHQSPALYR